MNSKRTGVSFPWANTDSLAEALKTGEITLPMAIRQVAAVDRESLKIIEDVAGESEAFYNQSRATSSKNEKLIADLTEKCQAMQQALLYKEEQFHEKCRELERYKVICEISARAACNDDLLFARPDPHPGPHDDLLDFERNVLNKDDDNNHPESDSSQVKKLLAGQAIIVPGRTSLRHAKISSSQLEARKNKEKMRDLGFAEPSTSAAVEPDVVAAASSGPEKGDRQQADETDIVPEFPDSYYWGGPCKRTTKRVRRATQIPIVEAKTGGPVSLTLPERIRMVGGILGPKAKLSDYPPAASLFQPAASSSDLHQSMPARSVTPVPMRSVDPNTAAASTNNDTTRGLFRNSKDDTTRVKVTLGGQSNEVLSSLKNISHGLKQKVVEKDLRRQVAECSWTRIARRKKEWPF